MIPRGFRMWVKKALNDDRDQLASYLIHCCKEGPQDSLAWPLLEATGDKTYDIETFKKAADIVIKTEFLTGNVPDEK
jgi:hypothetical protein